MRLGALLAGLVAASAVSANNGNGKGNAKPGKPGKNGKGKPNIVLIRKCRSGGSAIRGRAAHLLTSPRWISTM